MSEPAPRFNSEWTLPVHSSMPVTFQPQSGVYSMDQFLSNIPQQNQSTYYPYYQNPQQHFLQNQQGVFQQTSHQIMNPNYQPHFNHQNHSKQFQQSFQQNYGNICHPQINPHLMNPQQQINFCQYQTLPYNIPQDNGIQFHPVWPLSGSNVRGGGFDQTNYTQQSSIVSIERGVQYGYGPWN